jgi:hypothetical protein
MHHGVVPVRKITKIDRTKGEQSCLEETAYHEAGHAVVCEHFHIKWRMEFAKSEESSMKIFGMTGRLHFHSSTGFRNAVIGWAGNMVDLMLHEKNAGKTDLLDYYKSFNRSDPMWMSPTDSAAIEGTPFKYRALKTAVRILKHDWNDMERIVKSFLQDAKAIKTNRTKQSAK